MASPVEEPTRRHRLEYALFRGARAVLLWLPERVAIALGGGLGWVAGKILRIRRRVVEENLARAFPDRDPAWRARVLVDSYRHLGRESVMTFRLAHETRESILARTEVEGVDLPALLAEGHSLLLVTGHLGNWELGAALLAARGMRLSVVALPQRNALFDQDLVELRRRLGVEVISSRVARSEVLARLGEGGAVAIVGDQNAGRSGIFVDFFGVPASTARGPAVFALRGGAKVVFVAPLAVGGHPRRYVLHVEAVEVERTGDVATDVRRLSEALVEALERRVRQAPEQYFWVHRRWKTRPPSETPGGGDSNPSARGGVAEGTPGTALPRAGYKAS